MLSFLGRPLPPAFELRTFVVGPGGARPYDGADWHDALVVVERGEVELEWRSGSRRRFSSGAVLWLSDLPLRALHNGGATPAVLVAVSRRRLHAPFNAALAALIAASQQTRDDRRTSQACEATHRIDRPLSAFR